jgi:hypothetical protein
MPFFLYTGFISREHARSVVVSVVVCVPLTTVRFLLVSHRGFSLNNIYRYSLSRIESQRNYDVPVTYGVFDDFGDLSEDAIFKS